ncbi:hypothetical protein SteCoe_35298 [Stentor coeruleus]|uniref:Uncharacterized protein n=1 Tax=Stentor coeruleus TaxID=5963 RepID=A0A1R2ASM3_9CILI|nr:hypothetical protein SteCoe_35298 [Stentor coeruleus]
MVSKLFLILLPLLIMSQGFDNSGSVNKNTGSDQALINCLTDSKVVESIIFRTLDSLASGVYISKSFEYLSKFWGILSRWYTVCGETFSNKPDGIDEEFPIVDWVFSFNNGIFNIDEIDYPQKNVLENREYENCMYAVDGLAKRISEVKSAIELEDRQNVADILYSFKDFKETLKSSCT